MSPTFRLLVDLSLKNKVPIIAPAPPFVEAGALVSVAADYEKARTRAGEMARRILWREHRGVQSRIAVRPGDHNQRFCCPAIGRCRSTGPQSRGFVAWFPHRTRSGATGEMENMLGRLGITGKLIMAFSVCIFVGLWLAMTLYSVNQLRRLLYEQNVRRLEARC